MGCRIRSVKNDGKVLNEGPMINLGHSCSKIGPDYGTSINTDSHIFNEERNGIHFVPNNPEEVDKRDEREF